MDKSNYQLPTVLITDNSVAVTGALKAIQSSVNNLKSDYRFVFVLPTGSTAGAFLNNLGFMVYFLPFIEISKKPGKLLLYLPWLISNSFKLAKIAGKEKVAIIHMNDFYNLTGIVARLFGYSGHVVTHVRFMPHRFGVLAKFWGLVNRLFADRIICVSKAVRSFFPVQDPKISVIYDPLPVAEKFPQTNRNSPSKTVQLLYLANFIQGKGQNFALEAFANAFRRNPNLRLKFIGGDMGLEKNRAFKQKLMDETLRLGLQEVVTFASFSDDVEKETKQADIALNFSESESFSLTCLEALYFGTPLIATDSGGPAELFENGKSGILVPNRDVKAMTEAILKLAANRTLRAQFSEEGRKYVSKKFSIENTSARLGRLYEEVLAERN